MKGLMVFSSLITGMVFSVWMATSDATLTAPIAVSETLEISANTPTSVTVPKAKHDDEQIDEKQAEERESESERHS